MKTHFPERTVTQSMAAIPAISALIPFIKERRERALTLVMNGLKP
jgi:hypothetical protein